MMLTRQNAFSLGLFIGGAVAGGIGGYLFAKKKYAMLADEEIESVKARYSVLRKDDYPTPEDRLVALTQERDMSIDEILASGVVITDEDGYVINEPSSSEDVVVLNSAEYDGLIQNYVITSVPDEEIISSNQKVTRSIFGTPLSNAELTASDPGTDPNEVIMPNEDFEKPYAITVDDFMDGEPDYEKISLTYWEEDDTLSDERETIVPDHEGTVGGYNLNKFGLGSKDRNMVYVRNHKLNADFEIVRDERGFSDVILNINDRRSKAPVLRMREGD